MPRIRSVKPEYATSAAIADLTIPAMLHFVLLWTYADDAGRGVDDPRVIKGALWPLRDEVTAAQVEAWQHELADHGRIVRYEVDGKRLFQVANFREHQKPNRPTESKLPEPSLSPRAPSTEATNPPVDLPEHADSLSPHGAITAGGVDGVGGGGGEVDGDVVSGSISGDLPVPPEPVAAEPLPEVDPEQAARKALNIYCRTKATNEATGDPTALAASIGKAAINDGRLDLLRELVDSGLTAEDAATKLLDPFSMGRVDGPRNVPAAESTHPLLRSVPAFCGDCEKGWVFTEAGALARCPACNPNPIGAAS